MAKNKKLPELINRDEANRLFNIINTRYTRGKRNLAVFKLMLNTGLRVAELCNLESRYLNLKKCRVKVVDGKGGKDRKVFFKKEILPYLKAWVKEKERLGIKSKYFFCTYSKGKEGKKLIPRYLQITLKQYAKKAGIDKNIHPHILRHTWATAVYNSNRNLEALRRLLGHGSIQTTQIYINLSDTVLKERL